MALAEVTAGSQTAVISTEHTLSEQSSGGEVYVLAVDLTNLASGDVVELYLYTKVQSTDSATVYSVEAFADAQGSEPTVISVPVPAPHYFKATLKQTAGTGRAFPWSLMSL